MLTKQVLKQVSYLSYDIESVACGPIYLRLYRFVTKCPNCNTKNISCIEEHNLNKISSLDRKVHCSKCLLKYYVKY